MKQTSWFPYDERSMSLDDIRIPGAKNGFWPITGQHMVTGGLDALEFTVMSACRQKCCVEKLELCGAGNEHR